MDQENFEYLKDKLKYSGFEEKFNAALEKQIKAGTPAFTLSDTMDIEGKKVGFDLHFRKSEINDRYFYNKMDVTVPNANPELEGKSHGFYQNQGITAKEAFNLLEGRAVHKGLLNAEKEQYHAWLQLDLGNKEENGNFKMNQYHEKYGFDLQAKLQELPIKELGDQTKTDWMLKSLQKGNQYPVTMDRGGTEEIMYIVANPKFKSVNVYDVSMASVKTKDLLIGQGKDMKAEKNGVEQKSDMAADKKKDLKQGKETGSKLPQTPKIPKSRKSARI